MVLLGPRHEAEFVARKGALDFRDETELLFPVYNEVRAQGAGFEYYVIGWAVFHVTGWDIRGVNDGKIYGYFVDMVWTGVGTSSGSPISALARSSSSNK